MNELEQPIGRSSAVLRAAARGLNRRQTASECFLSEGAVKYTRERLRKEYAATHGIKVRSLAPIVVEAERKGSIPLPDISADVNLTLRQGQIVALISEGATNSRISKCVGVAEITVKHNVSRLMDTFQAPNRVALAAKVVVWEQRQGEDMVHDPEEKIWQNPRIVQILNGRANGCTREEMSKDFSLTVKQIKTGLKKIRMIKDPNRTEDFEDIMARLIQSGVRKGAITVHDVPDNISFTAQELQILDLIDAGKSKGDIRAILNLSHSALNHRLENIYPIFHVTNFYHFVGKMTAYRINQKGNQLIQE